MLILSLHLDDAVVINDNVEVIFLSLKGSQLRLGFKAPKEVPIHRKKVWNRIQAEKITP